MQVVVYVEGASDKQALTALLRSRIEQMRRENVYVQFIERDSKGDILNKGARKALTILRNRPEAHVVLLPDLYPPHAGGIPHETVDQLVDGVWERLHDRIADWTVEVSQIENRFHVFCLKYELEALILAAEESLCRHLETTHISVDWAHSIEDQNHDRPPEIVVREIFASNGAEYVKEEDAPEILARADAGVIAERCPQQFAPFVEFLDDLGGPG